MTWNHPGLAQRALDAGDEEIAALKEAYSQMNDAFIKVDAENARLRAILTQFVAACETAPPTSLITEIGLVCSAAKEVLS